MEAHRDEFIELMRTGDEDKCIEYIMKYDDFYGAISIYQENMLQIACGSQLATVAMALIDRKCNLTHQNRNGSTALMYASCYGLNNVVAYIIDHSTDIATRNSAHGTSEMMYLCARRDEENIIKMIEYGYDIYYKSDIKRSLFTEAIYYKLGEVVKKLMDIDTNFINELNHYTEIKDMFYHDITKYCRDKYDAYKDTIIATMNDATSTNALYQSFHTTYAVGLVDVICDFILLQL